ncbi:PepSY domain-containing protein [Motiliproteus sediminis]|uniref:PepSY domain-containing protein n=1 Tax=Motiliproteus sediminis TaxID=1468178 RepID=UPI001AEFF7C5|nr:PepSY domain-containing protein [Motiliproteus sediminis]
MSTGWLYRVTAAGTISLLALLWLPPAQADRLDQEQVLRLLDAGEVQPLEQLLERHRARLAGRLIDLELEVEHGRLVYELKVVDERGRVREYLVDAKSGDWLGEDD